jgi:hypothetical protein
MPADWSGSARLEAAAGEIARVSSPPRAAELFQGYDTQLALPSHVIVHLCLLNPTCPPLAPAAIPHTDTLQATALFLSLPSTPLGGVSEMYQELVRALCGLLVDSVEQVNRPRCTIAPLPELLSHHQTTLTWAHRWSNLAAKLSAV